MEGQGASLCKQIGVTKHKYTIISGEQRQLGCNLVDGQQFLLWNCDSGVFPDNLSGPFNIKTRHQGVQFMEFIL